MQNTAYDMRISDWSSDVCAYDLCVDGELGLGRVPEHQAEILLGDLARANRRLQAGQSGPRTGKHQYAAGVTVESVHQFQMLLRSGGTQQFDRAMTDPAATVRSEEHTSELQSLMRISYAVFCLKKKNRKTIKE